MVEKNPEKLAELVKVDMPLRVELAFLAYIALLILFIWFLIYVNTKQTEIERLLYVPANDSESANFTVMEDVAPLN